MKIANILPLFYFSVLAAAIGPPSGRYIIIPEAFDHQGYVGRSKTEDRSLNPKQVLLLNDAPPEPWFIERQSDGKYVLNQRGGFAGERNGLLLRSFSKTKRQTDGELNHRPKTAIVSLHRDPIRGWVSPSPSDASKQIRVQPLIVGPSDPPFFPSTELFQLIPFYNE
ncbi:hypothetical protein VE04_06558 [Pseudogymnoascus sp. 24MN13]|nr:hypothetical protein VE04_06558 [Pseudogymnoascus sp. 24MN13]